MCFLIPKVGRRKTLRGFQRFAIKILSTCYLSLFAIAGENGNCYKALSYSSQHDYGTPEATWHEGIKGEYEEYWSWRRQFELFWKPTSKHKLKPNPHAQHCSAVLFKSSHKQWSLKRENLLCDISTHLCTTKKKRKRLLQLISSFQTLQYSTTASLKVLLSSSLPLFGELLVIKKIHLHLHYLFTFSLL